MVIFCFCANAETERKDRVRTNMIFFISFYKVENSVTATRTGNFIGIKLSFLKSNTNSIDRKVIMSIGLQVMVDEQILPGANILNFFVPTDI